MELTAQRTALPLSLAAGIALVALLASCGHAPSTVEASSGNPAVPPPNSTAPDEIVLTESARANAGIRVEQGAATALSVSVEANGVLTPNGERTWNVGAFVPGRISEVSVNLGDPVSAGDILVRVHSHDVHDTRAMYFQAREALRQAEARMAFAGRARDRAGRLLTLQAVSQEQADQADTEWQSSTAAVESARAGVTRERTHLEEVLGIPFDAAGNPEDVETVAVKSPVSGVVIERKATAGTVVNSGDPLLTITDPSSLWAIANVNEADLPALRVGQRAVVKVRAWPGREFAGKIQRLGESLDPTTRTLQVRILVPNPDRLLKPEMFASVSIAGNELRKALTVPRDAIQDVGGRTVVFIQIAPGKFRPQAVTLGTAAGMRVEILQGLKADDRTVVAGSFALKSEMLKGSGE